MNSFRETIRAHSTADAKIIRTAKQPYEYAHVQISVRPLDRGQGVHFRWDVLKLEIPIKFAAFVMQGVFDALEQGPRGFEVIDLELSVVSGSYHEQDSTQQAFVDAAKEATRKAIVTADPMLLQAIDLVQITVPESFCGATTKALQGRGAIDGIEVKKGSASISAFVAREKMEDLLPDVLEITHGDARFSTSFARYEELDTEPPMGDDDWALIT